MARVPADQHAVIFNLYNDGMKVPQIAMRYDCTDQTVYNIIKRVKATAAAEASPANSATESTTGAGHDVAEDETPTQTPHTEVEEDTAKTAIGEVQDEAKAEASPANTSTESITGAVPDVAEAGQPTEDQRAEVEEDTAKTEIGEVNEVEDREPESADLPREAEGQDGRAEPNAPPANENVVEAMGPILAAQSEGANLNSEVADERPVASEASVVAEASEARKKSIPRGIPRQAPPTQRTAAPFFKGGGGAARATGGKGKQTALELTSPEFEEPAHFRTVEEVLAALRPMLKNAVRSGETVAITIRPVDAASIAEDAA